MNTLLDANATPFENWFANRCLHHKARPHDWKSSADKKVIGPSLEFSLPTGHSLDSAQRAYRESKAAEHCTRAAVAANSVRHRESMRQRMDAITPLDSRHIATGGAMNAPDWLSVAVERALLTYGGIFAAAEVVRTSSRGDMLWPVVDDTDNIGWRISESENVTTATNAPASSDADFGQRKWGLYKYTSGEIVAPFELTDQPGVDVPAMLADGCFERIARAFAADLTNGLGVGEPWGIVPTAATVSAQSATAISWNDLLRLVAAVDPGHRIAGAGFMFHDDIRLYLKELRDGNGRPMWLENDGTLLGYPTFLNQSMDSTISSGKKTVLFGNLKKFKVRQHNVVRFVEASEAHRLNDRSGFAAYSECDGNLLDASADEARKPIKVLTH